MKHIVKKGATSNLFCIFIQDSSSTTGAGLTGLTSGSSGLVCYRARADDGNAGGTAISLSAGTKGTWSSGGFVEKDASNMPGVYELGVPDAVFATGSNYGIVMLKGATNQAPVVMEFELIAADVQDSVRLGLTALPNVASGSAGAIPTTGTGANQISVSSGQVILQSGTGTGQLDFTSGVVKANATQWLGGTIPAVNVTGVPLVDLKYTLGTISPATAGYVALDWGQVTNKTTANVLSGTTIGTLTTYTGNTPQTGDNYARTGAPAGASVSADIAAVKVDTAAVKVQTDKLAFTVANKVDANMLATNGDATAAANVAKTTRAIVRCTVSGVPTTTSIPTSACAPSGVDADQFKGRIITFDADTATTGLRGQSTDITASSASATPTFTVTALTSAPASGDTFSIT